MAIPLSPPSQTAERKAFWRRWQWWAGLIFWLIALLSLAVWLVFNTPILFVLANSSYFGKAEFSHASHCKDTSYRLDIYLYKNGDGYAQLVDGSGRAHGRSLFSDGTDLSPIWSDDCKQVSINTDKDPALLSARP